MRPEFEPDREEPYRPIIHQFKPVCMFKLGVIGCIYCGGNGRRILPCPAQEPVENPCGA